MLRPFRLIVTAELHVTRGSNVFDIVTFTDINMRKKQKAPNLPYIFRTECQKGFRLYVHQHTCMHGKTRAGLLLDLSANIMAAELMYINMHAQGNLHTFRTDC